MQWWLWLFVGFVLGAATTMAAIAASARFWRFLGRPE